MISKPYWNFVTGEGWRVMDIQLVRAIRFGPDGLYMGSAARLGSLKDGKRTCLAVTFIAPGRQKRIVSKTVDRRLKDISDTSLTQYWGRMITYGKKWPDWKKGDACG
jgi:hypothetical protein